MLTAADIISAKVIVQLGLAGSEDVRAFLRVADRDRGTRDLVNHLAASRKVDPKGVELIRHRTALYEHVRGESAYVRALEKQTAIPKAKVAQLIAGLERTAFRRRLGDVLVAQGFLTREQDAALATMQVEAMQKEDARIIERYRQEDFAGIDKPLIPGSRLDPADFRISRLFRGKETRALVDQAEIAAMRAAAVAGLEQERAPAPPQAPPQAPRPAPPPAPPPPERKPEPPKKTFAGGIDAVKKLKRIAAYSIVEVLGSGGMGCVFLGQQDGAGEFAAIKVMLDQAASPVEKGRFRREIRLTQGIKHRNVIGVIDSGETDDGLTYLVVPALAGKELRAILDAAPDKALEPQVACHILEQVLEGLQAVHDARIVHRDMKPENVFVLAGGKHEVKIMDFGLAKRGAEEDEADDAVFRTTPGEDIVGSPPYIAPESISQDEIDGRTDIYSVGVILFEMLTGKRPIESETAQGYLTQHLICPPPTLAEAAPHRKWAPELERLVERMLAKTRDERPASCRAILEELRSGLRAKIVKPVEEARPLAATIDAAPPPPPDEKAWGVKGLLGRLFAAKHG